MNEKLPSSTVTAALEPPLPLPPIDTDGASTYHINAAQVPLEFGGTLKSSKSSKNNSNQQSPLKKSHSLSNIATDHNGCYCTCFGGCGYGNQNRIAMPFWPAVLANLGICALLVGYIFIGSFVFLTIENSNKRVFSLDSNTAQHSEQIPQIIQRQQQQQHQQRLQQQTASVSNLQKQENNSFLNAASNTTYHSRNSRNARNTSNRTRHLAKTATTSSAIPEVSKHINDIHDNDDDVDGEAKMQHSIVENGIKVGAGGSTLNYDIQTLPLADVVANKYATSSADEDYINDDAIAYNGLTTLEDVERRRTVENIWDITVSLNILYKENWTRLAALEIAKFQDQLVKRLVMDLTLSTANGAATQSTSANGHNGKQQQHQPGNGVSGLGNYERQRFWQSENTQQHNQRQHWWGNQRKYIGGSHRGRFKSENFRWTFATAFLYSMTVITTVGYGTITARTALGRMVTIGYATLGIPLTLIYLSSIGSVLAKLLRYFCSTNKGICCCCCTKRTTQRQANISNNSIFNRHPQVADRKTELKLKHFQQPQQQQPLPYCYVRPPAATTTTQEMEMQQRTSGNIGSGGGGGAGIGIVSISGITGGSTFDNLSVATSVTETSRKNTTTAAVLSWSLAGPAGFCLIFLIVYVTFGAIVIALLEDWPLIDGIYFCFMSLSTIGFCDLLPGIDADGSFSRRSSTSINIAVWFCAVYILSGLTLTSMCVNLLHDEIASRMRVVVKFEKVHHETDKEQRESNFYNARS